MAVFKYKQHLSHWNNYFVKTLYETTLQQHRIWNDQDYIDKVMIKIWNTYCKPWSTFYRTLSMGYHIIFTILCLFKLITIIISNSLPFLYSDSSWFWKLQHLVIILDTNTLLSEQHIFCCNEYSYEYNTQYFSLITKYNIE